MGKRLFIRRLEGLFRVVVGFVVEGIRKVGLMKSFIFRGYVF